MRLRYTRRAASELERILTYINEHSPRGFRRVKKRIQTITTLLQRHPYIGRHTNISGIRCVTVTPYSYLIFYETIGDEIIIVGIRHSARNPLSMPDSDN